MNRSRVASASGHLDTSLPLTPVPAQSRSYHPSHWAGGRDFTIRRNGEIAAAEATTNIGGRPPERPARLQNAILLDSCDNHLVVQAPQYFFVLSGRRQRQRSESEDICHADPRHLSLEPCKFGWPLV